MSFWGWLTGRPNYDGETPNTNSDADVGAPSSGVVAGDPCGVEIDFGQTYSRSLPFPQPSPWSGWPGSWSTPMFETSTQMGLSALVDTAWAAIDLNASILSSLPAYRLKNGNILPPPTWLVNPDPTIYGCWEEFAKQLFWDYQMGEAFVLPMSTMANNSPLTFRVVPPWLVNVELLNGKREYTLGGHNVTDEILHIRNISNTADARGHSPLQAAGARIVTAGLLQKYGDRIAQTGGIPHYWFSTERKLTQDEADDLLGTWVESRIRHAGEPALVVGGMQLNQSQSMSARDMTLIEISQFTEARIAVTLKVPPFLLGLSAAAGSSMTYANATSLFDHHFRAGLRPMEAAVMGSLSYWALPRGQIIEINADEYTRPGLFERAQAYKILVDIGALTAQEVRSMERFSDEPGAASQITGVGDITGAAPGTGSGANGHYINNGYMKNGVNL